MEKVILKATVREDFGKSACKRLRRQGQIPAVVYKEGKPAVNIQIDDNELWHVLHTEAGSNVIVTIDIAGDDGKNSKKTVIFKETQLDPLNDHFVHVDFHEISLKEKLKVKVPIAVKGESIGVKEDEGVMAQTIWELEVECLPTEIPEHIDIHIDELRIGDAIHVKDVTPPANVQILDDPEQVIVSVSPPKAEEEIVEEEEAAEGAEEPEVIKKGKEEEEEAPEEAPGAEEKSE